ncbi:NAD(P)-dependent oxidoreductase [Apilactobacillus ozensis]|uniref:NAD(P)-dependent oxidoreductase n=2 Tax=Apilactobacillus ozensis TaxID=866801 RepID=UPI000704CEEB|nr:NAD(P)-dependent oxidoreductase [Apilactobacillus ozensis]
MNILVGTPNESFDIEELKQNFAKNNNFNSKIYFENDDLSQSDLDSINVLVGYNQELLDKMLNSNQSQLKWIQALSAGVDYFPLEKLNEKHVKLTTVSGIHAEPIAETVIGMVLGSYRFIDESARAQGWIKPVNQLKMIKNKKAVVYGTGSIGGRIGELLQAFKANTIGVNHSGHAANGFDQTFSMDGDEADIYDADLVINTLPLTPETKDFYNREFFNKLNNKPMYISIGRGPSTNTEDLTNALQQGQLSAAALDVTDPEPLNPDHPLWKMDNVVITSHISGFYAEYVEEALKIFDVNMKQFIQDSTLVKNEVNLSKGY